MTCLDIPFQVLFLKLLTSLISRFLFPCVHFANASGWIRGRDSTRVLHYEGGGSRTPCTDIVCPMYMRVWDMLKIANDPSETRPLILCEYYFLVHIKNIMT